MDGQLTSTRTFKERWNTLPLFVRGVLILLVIVVALTVLTAVRSIFSQLVGVSSGTSDLGFYGVGGGAPAYEMNTVSSKGVSRGAVDYSDGYYPPTIPQPGGTGTYDEGTYETKSYSAHIKTKAYDTACGTIESWKPLEYVVFESANRGDVFCSYRFKVGREHAQGILDQLTQLDPSDMNEQTDTVKRQVEDFTSQLDVLKKREALLADTLDKVSAAYDELVTLSKSAQDVETLAKVIDGKLNYIERLSQQRLQVATELDSIAKAKADLEDRIAFVTFDVSVEKVEYVNGKEIRDSWRSALRSFVRDANETLQQLTIGLLALILWLAQFILQALVFFIVVLVIAKYGWRATKKFWQS